MSDQEDELTDDPTLSLLALGSNLRLACVGGS